MNKTPNNFLLAGLVLLTNCAVGQAPSEQFTPQTLIQMAQENMDLSKWSLDTLYIAFAAEDPEVHQDSVAFEAVIFAEYNSLENNTSTRITAYQFRDEDGSIVNAGSSHTCSGINCASCVLKGHFIGSRGVYCKCRRKAHPQGGISYCNHTYSSGISFGGYGMQDHSQLLVDANSML